MVPFPVELEIGLGGEPELGLPHRLRLEGGPVVQVVVGRDVGDLGVQWRQDGREGGAMLRDLNAVDAVVPPLLDQVLDLVQENVHILVHHRHVRRQLLVAAADLRRGVETRAPGVHLM
ncbi:hypothetical protein PG990_014143 [Apiospora arundinis]